MSGSPRLINVAVACGALIAMNLVVSVPAASASNYYDAACDGASEAAGAFADAGLAADCLKLYGIALGEADGRFDEDALIVRSQVSSLLVRTINLAGVSLDNRRTFPDTDNMPDGQVLDEIERLAGAGIIAGYPDGFFHNNALTVAQAATMVIRSLQYIHTWKPSSPDIRDQGSTSANYDAAVNNGLLNRSATELNGFMYGSEPGDPTYRGQLADMVASAVQILVNYGITNSRSPFAWFNDGQHRVGDDIGAGTYRAPDTSKGCYWEREKGFSGSFEDITANDFSSAGPEIVTIDPSDAGFKSADCGYWSSDLKPMKSTSDPIPPGMWQVGSEVVPGTYRASVRAGSSSCYWERLKGYSGRFEDIAGNGSSSSSQLVTIMSSDAAFRSSHGCTDWIPT